MNGRPGLNTPALTSLLMRHRHHILLPSEQRRDGPPSSGLGTRTGLEYFLRLVLILFTTTFVLAGTAASSPAYAADDLYTVELKAWIPQPRIQVVASPWIPLTAPIIPSVTCLPPVVGDLYTGGGDDHIPYDGSYRVIAKYSFLWDGRRMAHVSVDQAYGTSHMTQTNALGQSCSLSRTTSKRTSITASGNSFQMLIDSANPFYESWRAPNINTILNARFVAPDRLAVDMITDKYPSHGFRILKNGKPLATVVDFDASCVNTGGPTGGFNAFNGLRIIGPLSADRGYPGAHRGHHDIDLRVIGQRWFGPCGQPRPASLSYPAPANSVPTPTPVPNQAPRAWYTYKRLPGAGNIVSFNGTGSSDPDGRVTTWRWTIGSTVIAAGPTPTVALGAGTGKTVTLSVTDNRGVTAAITKTLALPNRAPVIRSVAPVNGSISGTNTPVLSARATDDDADPLKFFFRVTGPSVDISSGWVGSSWRVPQHRLDPGTRYQWTVTARDPSGATSRRTNAFTVAMLPTAADVIPTSTGGGYWQVASDGGVFSYGDARFYGSLPGINVRVDNIIGMARTPTNNGYWLVGRDGVVFAFGDAPFAGSLPGLGVRVTNIVGMAPTRTGKGYWLVGSDGGVFAFGDAGFFGSMGGKPLNAPVEGIAPTPSNAGYWLAARDGGIFAFGDAPFLGSMGGKPLNAPVVDLDVTPDGKGYWMTAEDGGVFAFGNAGFFGSMAGKPLNGHITGMAATPNGKGYFLNGCDGGIFAFGNAVFRGSNPTYQCRGV